MAPDLDESGTPQFVIHSTNSRTINAPPPHFSSLITANSELQPPPSRYSDSAHYFRFQSWQKVVRISLDYWALPSLQFGCLLA